MLLFGQPLRPTAGVGAAGKGVGVIYIQVDEQVRLGDALPHVGHVGMFLGRVPRFVTSGFERLSEAAFAGGAGANHGNAQRLTVNRVRIRHKFPNHRKI